MPLDLGKVLVGKPNFCLAREGNTRGEGDAENQRRVRQGGRESGMRRHDRRDVPRLPACTRDLNSSTRMRTSGWEQSH